jgi:hypothetical protein
MRLVLDVIGGEAHAACAREAAERGLRRDATGNQFLK